MRHKKAADVIGTIMLFAGFVLAFLPHAAHVAIGLGDESSHIKHIISGVVLIIAALIILIYNNDALKHRFRKRI